MTKPHSAKSFSTTKKETASESAPLLQPNGGTHDDPPSPDYRLPPPSSTLDDDDPGIMFRAKPSSEDVVDDNSPEEIVAIDRELPWHRNTSSDAAVSDPHARGERNQSTHDGEQSGEEGAPITFNVVRSLSTQDNDALSVVITDWERLQEDML